MLETQSFKPVVAGSCSVYVDLLVILGVVNHSQRFQWVPGVGPRYFLVKQLKGWRHIEVSWNCEARAARARSKVGPRWGTLW